MRIRILFLLCLWYVSAASVLPQSPDGRISGLVVDSTGAVIVGAEVVLVNEATDVRYFGQTNNEGIYNVPNILPGTYRLQVSKLGFKTIIKPEVVVHVQDALAVNFTLPVGAVSETVTVEGGTPLINTTDASVSTVVDRQFAENLPMNGRSFQTLIDLTPGVVVTSSSAFDSGQFSVNGQRASSNYWMVDGVSANVGIGASFSQGNGFGGAVGTFSALGGTNSLVSVDALQEFRIQTSSFAPEFGRTPGAQISVLTRSGTNQFHGTAFDYLRNDVLDANNWFADSVGAAKPKERQNDFGGTLSGPIVRDKAFFFFSYEGLRLRLPETTLSNVPDSLARQNAVAAMQPYLDAFPLPTTGAPDNTATGVAQLNASYSNPATLDAYSLRIDDIVNSKWSIFGRYNYSPSEFDVRGGSGGTGALSVVQPTQINVQTGTVGTTWTVTPLIANDLRFNYSRTNSASRTYIDNFAGATPLAASPFPIPYTDQNGFFTLVISSLGVGNSLEEGHVARNIQRQVNLVDSVGWQRARHSFRFGVDYRRLSPITDPQQYAQESLIRTVSSAQTGNVFLGTIASTVQATLLFRNLSAYAQDTWRVVPRLTLTYGLRWDVDFAPSSLNGPSIPAVTGYSLSDLSQLAVAPAGAVPFKTRYGNVAPRLGVAYEISQRRKWQTVVRGGFGVFYDLVSAEAGNLLSLSAPPFGAITFFRNRTFPYNSAESAPPPIPSTGQISNLSVFNPNLRLPYSLQWNVALEQSLGKEQVISATYVGAVGNRLLESTVLDFPPTNPGLSGLLVDNTASSHYNALQLQFRRNLSRGLQILASYSWSHSLDDASASSYGNASNRGVPSNNDPNRGNSDFDIRNAVSAAVMYDVPAPHIKGVVNAVLRGWSTENLILARSAPPVDLTDIFFFELENDIQTNIRPDIVSGQPLYLYGSQYPGGKAFNPNAFADPPTDPTTFNPTRQGNLPRNYLRGFGAMQWDFAVHRDFPIRESLKLQFRAELFNVLNHPNFGPPFNQFESAGFGVSNDTLAQSLAGAGGVGGGAFSPLYQIGGPRSVQLALKLRF